jgi:hypothetical protein
MQSACETATRLLGNWIDTRIEKKVRTKNTARERRDAQLREHWTSRIPRPRRTGGIFPEMSQCSTSTQLGSKFFAMLPPEIRQNIYALAFGGEWLGLRLVDDPRRASFIVSGNSRGVLSFPKTCRLAYSESIETVYERNTFSTSNMTCILFLPCFITPSWFNTIRHLHISFVVHQLYLQTHPPKLPPGDESTYEETWSVISCMEGLRSLDVVLVSSSGHVAAEIEARLFQPLMECQRVQRFDVKVDWVAPLKTSSETPWPFKVEWRS